jgi:hypothetical protein
MCRIAEGIDCIALSLPHLSIEMTSKSFALPVIAEAIAISAPSCLGNANATNCISKAIPFTSPHVPEHAGGLPSMSIDYLRFFTNKMCLFNDKRNKLISKA